MRRCKRKRSRWKHSFTKLSWCETTSASWNRRLTRTKSSLTGKRSRCSNTSRGPTDHSRRLTCCSKRRRTSSKIPSSKIQAPKKQQARDLKMQRAERDVTERPQKSAGERETDGQDWFEVRDVAAISSPALLIYRERVEENLRRMVKIAGGT